MKKAVIYIHGKGGSATECEHYKPLFPEYDVIGILYGSKDTSYENIAAFAEKHNAKLTVMENGEHWFHTEEQMRFLDNWIGE